MNGPRDAPQRSSGWVLGHVAGAPVVLAPSSLLAVGLFALVLAPRWSYLGGGAYLVAAVFAVLMFASVLVHELAHGLMARRRGQVPQEFVLTLWGGHTTFSGQADSPSTSALVAVVGPVANLVLGALFWVASWWVPSASLLAQLLVAGALSNGFVGLFNLLPGLPLDGGRVLEAAVWAVTGDRTRGTVVAAWLGRVVAVGVVLLAVGLPLLRGSEPDLVTVVWTAMIGAFLFSGAGAALRWARATAGVEALSVESVGRAAFGVPYDWSVAQTRGTAAALGGALPVLLGPQGPAAYADPAAWASVPEPLAASTALTTVSVPLPYGAVVDGALRGAPLLQAVAAAAGHGPGVVAVRDGQVVALLLTADLTVALQRAGDRA